ncbi:hypothetical protein BDQ17DRAFT_966015 [Cyathus striatus]|nr:hypothetical protein BDQ17DRAFT_966015 [Cyathus striatus]
MSTELVEALYRLRLVASFDVGSSMLFAYDIFLTLGLEIELVWCSKWTYMTVLYLLQRYLPIIDTLWLVLQHQVGIGLSKSACHLVYTASGWTFIVGFMASEIILTLRAFAIWNRNKILLVGLPIFFICCWVPDIIFMHLFLRSMEFGDLPSPAFTGCLVVNGSSILAMCWVVLMIYEAGIVILIVIPGVASYRSGGNTELYRTVYRDGVLYYVTLLALSALNVVLILTLPRGYVNLLSSFAIFLWSSAHSLTSAFSVERILHSILTSRVILHLRQHCQPHQERWDGLTNMSLENRPVGSADDLSVTPI